MSTSISLLPFRWDVARRERLGSLLDNAQASDTSRVARFCSAREVDRLRTIPTTYEGFLRDLLNCAVQVVASAGDADFVFVGRSPECLFDLLTGLLSQTSWRDRLTLLQFSIACSSLDAVRRAYPKSVLVYRVYLDLLGLSPAKLTVRVRPVAFTDLICGGRTMVNLLRLIQEWAREEGADWPAIRRKLRVIGIVRPSELKPLWKRRAKPWHWRDDAEWCDEILHRGALSEVVVANAFWEFIGEISAKVTPSYTPDKWGNLLAAEPNYRPDHLNALRSARALFETGCTKATRTQFARRLAKEHVAMREPNLRKLLQELRDR